MATWPWCHLLTTETLKISKLQQSVSAMTVRLSHCALSCNCKVSQLARLCRLAMGEGQPADIADAMLLEIGQHGFIRKRQFAGMLPIMPSRFDEPPHDLAGCRFNRKLAPIIKAART